ncbi:MAG: phosphopyruvate hydratase [Nocardioides sp.]
MRSVSHTEAIEILDSRGQPTLEVTVVLSDGSRATAGVPAGASTGAYEVAELRDGEPDRYGGRGVLAAVRSVRWQINDRIAGSRAVKVDDLAAIDRTMLELDGTDTLSRLGANAIVGVSIALTKALARAHKIETWELLQRRTGHEARLPVPHFNVVNGGAHARNALAFQEFMIAPVGSPSFAEALRAGAEIYAMLRRMLDAEGISTALGDEGGFAPPLRQPRQILTRLVAAIEACGYRAGRDGIAIALDPAANGFFDGSEYVVDEHHYSSVELIDLYSELVEEFPIWSIEDGMAEDDHGGWREMTAKLPQIQIMGDDLFVSQATRVDQGASEGLGTACLLKPNQVGTLTSVLETVQMCHRVGFAQMASHRSGETSDPFIADFAVGIGCGQVKSGAPARGERVAKYNRLLAIERRTGLPYGLRKSDVHH